MLSVPGAFPDFTCCIACVTSCSVGTPVAISRSPFGVEGGGSAVMVTYSLIITYEKCSVHLLGLSFLCCKMIPFFVLDIAYTCLGVSAELFSQSINSVLLSLHQFPLSLQHCPH